MKLVMTLLVRDEADIVEEMLEAHFALGVDFVVATDNRSVDGTRRILRRWARRGRLHLIDEPGDDYRQAEWVTRMARMAAADHGADWVINADADEFWLPLAGGSLKDAFAELPTDVGLVAARRYNFVVRPEVRGGGRFHERQRWRRTDSLTQDGQEMGLKVAHRASPSADVAMGNHTVDGVPGRRVDGVVEVLHFPLRTFRGYAEKIRVGTAALEANEAYPAEIGAHWRRSADLDRSGRLAESWQDWTFDDARLAQAIESGDVIRDDRVDDLLKRRDRRRWVARFGRARS